MANRWRNSGNSGWLYILGGSKITADGDCSHEIKRRLLLGRKVMTNLDSILKKRDITLSTKVRLVKAMVFPVVMYGCESWTIKKAECWRISLLNCGVTNTLESPLDCKEIQPVYPKGDQSWVFIGNTLKLKLQYFGHLMWRADSFEKTLILGKVEGRRRRGWQWIRWHHRLNGHRFGCTPGVDDGQGCLVCCGSWGCKESHMTDWLNWT